jgi:phospholipid-transporting ATPase
MERLGVHDDIVEKTLLHLEEYAAEGLRTLCLAVREVSESEFREWWDVYNTAQTTVSGNRADELDKAAELIEHDFTLLGATAIEDKLQDGVPDTIHTLQTAGIKVWVLTGDRQETAINIGMSCKLISEDMTLLIINEESAEATRNNIQKKLDAIRSQHAGGIEMETLALVIDGKSLTFALEKDMEKMFLDLAVMCKAVVCCRVSPLQKALVVKLVKRHLKSILLAIGDGANDVSMIQAAHIGVGISGMEGLQAARSADVSIAQFRFLRKLLLVHGAWSYQRISKVILYFYYKNTALFITQFWYSFQNAFSGQVIVESWTLSLFNVAFTVLPPFVLGIFDQFVNARLLDRYPQLYQLTQKGVFFRRHNFWSWVGNGFYHSLILYYGSILIYWDDAPLGDGTTAGHWVWGTAMYTAGLVTVLAKAALITNIWTKYTVIAIPGSMAIWFIFLPIYAFVAPKLNFSTEYVNTLPIIMSSPRYWLTIIALPAVCLIRDFAWKYAKRMYYPQTYHHVQEIQKYNIQDYRPRYVTDLYIYNSDYYQMIAHALRTSLTHSQNGAIPEGDPQSPPSTAHAQTARLRFLANGRESSACLAGLRYNKGARKVRRDDKQSSMMKVAVKGQIERLVCFLVRQQLVDRAERSWWHEILGCERLYLGMCVWRLASEKVGLLYLVSADDLHEGDFVSRSIV